MAGPRACSGRPDSRRSCARRRAQASPWLAVSDAHGASLRQRKVAAPRRDSNRSTTPLASRLRPSCGTSRHAPRIASPATMLVITRWRDDTEREAAELAARLDRCRSPSGIAISSCSASSASCSTPPTSRCSAWRCRRWRASSGSIRRRPACSRPSVWSAHSSARCSGARSPTTSAAAPRSRRRSASSRCSPGWSPRRGTCCRSRCSASCRISASAARCRWR